MRELYFEGGVSSPPFSLVGEGNIRGGLNSLPEEHEYAQWMEKLSIT